MTDGTDDPQATDFPDPPPTLVEGLLQASLERPLTASKLGHLRAAAEADDSDYLALWAGQGVAAARALPAAALVQELVREWHAARLRIAV